MNTEPIICISMPIISVCGLSVFKNTEFFLQKTYLLVHLKQIFPIYFNYICEERELQGMKRVSTWKV